MLLKDNDPKWSELCEESLKLLLDELGGSAKLALYQPDVECELELYVGSDTFAGVLV